MRSIVLIVLAILVSSIMVVSNKNVTAASLDGQNTESSAFIIVPENGTSISNHIVTFGWYHVENTGKYFLQVDNNIDFSSPEIETYTKNVIFTSQTLSDGIYYWRVKAYKSNTEALWLWEGIAQFEIFTAIGITAVKDLAVPCLQQHKDTRMLCLDGCPPTGAHAWDVDHVIRGCVHDNWYCARASIAMINRYYGGDLSQDRISYYAYGGGPPEDDLGHGIGMWPHERGVFSWALGDHPITWYNAKPDFKDITDEIDAGRPVLVIQGNGLHVVVVKGYETNGVVNTVHVNDPWTGTQCNIDYATWNVNSTYWIAPGAVNPRSNEPSLIQDSDGDGIVDFDETNRFGTNPNNKDSDGDGSSDKSEIAYYTFTTHNPDPNRNGIRMELDPNETPPPPGVGGVVIPVDKFVLLAPYIGLASTILVAMVATAVYVKRRKEKQ